MLTTAITGAIYTFLKLIGQNPNPATVAAIWVGIKVLIVGAGLFFTFAWKKNKP
jgi:hypothetical protein